MGEAPFPFDDLYVTSPVIDLYLISLCWIYKDKCEFWSLS